MFRSFCSQSSKIVEPACKIQFTSDPSCDRKTMAQVSLVQVSFHTDDPPVEATSSKKFLVATGNAADGLLAGIAG
jgi:hypothetical protein